MLIGFESPETWNERQREMLQAGQTAANLAHCNTWMRGYDIDEVEKELIGTCGTPINLLKDMEICFKDIPLDRISVALNDCAPFTSTAMFFSMADKQGLPYSCLRGTTNQSDFLSHYVSLHMYCRFSLEGHRRATIDCIKFCTDNVPLWNPLSVIGQHMQQAGATPVQELAFTLSSAIYYVEECIKAGLDIDAFASRVSFFFDSTISVMEEIAKFRAGRRIWAKLMKERWGAKDPRSQRFKFHAQTSGRELTRQQVLNNLARVAFQAMAAVLGGAQSIHTDAYDEALNSPSAEAARLALMTQNIIAEETGLADVIDPLGGSYYLETLTAQMEEKTWEYINKIEAMGGMLKAVEKGFIQNEISRSSLKDVKAIEQKEKIVVGLNEYVIPEEMDFTPKFPKPDPVKVQRHIDRVREIKKTRDQGKARMALDHLKRVADGKTGNLFEAVLNAVKCNASHGEVVSALRDVYGEGKPLIVGF
ncbi:MAG: methylmalonyl-CoA mutase [Candidatus Tectomicrobia bacterium]|uniref:Methylmalonyl-CoA mutase n=1 Tax=Tectimicrobiota bacterium TaxID=2528274 RepID=A0A933LQJ8_UNCTE|nr:methylmalonyl-CoA mutase [Candidatus Tectomicrobia bacterium]